MIKGVWLLLLAVMACSIAGKEISNKETYGRAVTNSWGDPVFVYPNGRKSTPSPAEPCPYSSEGDEEEETGDEEEVTNESEECDGSCDEKCDGSCDEKSAGGDGDEKCACGDSRRRETGDEEEVTNESEECDGSCNKKCAGGDCDESDTTSELEESDEPVSRKQNSSSHNFYSYGKTVPGRNNTSQTTIQRRVEKVNKENEDISDILIHKSQNYSTKNDSKLGSSRKHHDEAVCTECEEGEDETEEGEQSCECVPIVPEMEDFRWSSGQHCLNLEANVNLIFKEDKFWCRMKTMIHDAVEQALGDRCTLCQEEEEVKPKIGAAPKKN